MSLNPPLLEPPGQPEQRGAGIPRLTDRDGPRGVGGRSPRPSGRQLSLFGVEAADPSAADLAGLLAGPGQVVRMGGTARVSVVVDAPWRVHVLMAEMAVRGLAATWVPTADSHLGVRTAYARSLAPLGAAWLRGAVKRPPAGFHLDGARLRLWAAAAGTVGPWGFLLRLGSSDEECWAAVGAALAAIGLPAVLVTPRVPRVAGALPPGADPELDGFAETDADGLDGPVAEGWPPDGERELSAEPELAMSGSEEGRVVGRSGAIAAGHPDEPGSRPIGASVGPGDRAAGETPGVGGIDGVGEPADGTAESMGGTGGVNAVTAPGGNGAQPGPPRPAPIGGPAYRITGRRRLARLAELVGERPPAAPSDAWPL